MAVFSVLSVDYKPGLKDAIVSEFPNDHIEISPTSWLVAGKGTAQDISNRIGLTPDKTAVTGSAVVMTMGGYFGYAPNNIWEWIKAKLETAYG